MRVVRMPDGRVVFDDTGRMAGRGAYLCADGACWLRALEKGTLQRALEAPLTDEIRIALQHGPAATTADAVAGPVHGAAGGATMKDVNGGELIGKE